jgi:PAS domain S-box-containing protein
MAAIARADNPAPRWITPGRAGVTLAALLIAIITFVTRQHVEVEHAQAVDAITHANSNLAIAYEENAAGTIADIDDSLRLLEREYRDRGVRNAIAMSGDWPVNRALIRGLALTRENGDAIFATGDEPASERTRLAHIDFHRAARVRAIHIGDPERTSPGAWRIPMSRPIENADGSFGGIVFAMVDPAYLARFFDRTSLGEHDLVALVGLDGIALARHTGGKTAFGDDMRKSTLMSELAARPSGNFRSSGSREGVVRLISYRTMERFPLAVMVGVSEDEALADVRERTRLYYLLAALASNVIALVAFGVTRSLERQKRHIQSMAFAQARLAESEARASAITECMAGAVITTTVDGVITGVNTAACRMYGYAEDEMIGRNIGSLVHESRRAYALAVIEDLRTHASHFRDPDRETLCVRRDGTAFEAEILISKFALEGEIAYVGIVHDISDRKKLERALRANEALFRATFDQALVGIVHTSLEGRFIRVNQMACDMLGYSEAEMLARGYRDVTHAEDLPASVKHNEELIADPGMPFEYNVTRRFIRKDGSVMWALTCVSVVRRDDGYPDFFLTMVQDITKLREAREGLERRTAFFESLVETSPDGILVVDPDGRKVVQNRRMADLLKIPRAFAENPDDTDQLQYVTSQMIDSRKFLDKVLYLNAHPDETSRDELATKAGLVLDRHSGPIRGADGQPYGRIWFFRDITELKRVEQMKTEFVSTVSHELRTPLTSIRGSLGLLAGGVAGALPESARQLVAIADSNCERLIRLVNDILDVEKIASGKMVFEMSAMPLGPLLDRVAESNGAFARAHQVALRVIVPAEPVICSVDADRFIQLMTNLVSNAVKFSPANAAVEIELSRIAEGHARIEVRDRGPGIPKEFHSRMFQRFSQADASSSRAKTGTGLGLSIAKGIAERLGGRIGFETAPGAGTTFFVELPVAATAQPQPVAAVEAKEA